MGMEEGYCCGKCCWHYDLECFGCGTYDLECTGKWDGKDLTCFGCCKCKCEGEDCGPGNCEDWCQAEFADTEAMCDTTDCKGCAECSAPLCDEAPEAPDDSYLYDSSRDTSQP